MNKIRKLTLILVSIFFLVAPTFGAAQNQFYLHVGNYTPLDITVSWGTENCIMNVDAGQTVVPANGGNIYLIINMEDSCGYTHSLGAHVTFTYDTSMGALATTTFDMNTSSAKQCISYSNLTSWATSYSVTPTKDRSGGYQTRDAYINICQQGNDTNCKNDVFNGANPC